MFSTKKMLLSKLGGPNVDRLFATALGTSGTNFPQPSEFDLRIYKSRSVSGAWSWMDKLRGISGSTSLDSSSTAAQSAQPGIGTGATSVAYFLTRAKKFFDIVTYTGNGVAGRQIPHGLGVKPGMIVVKRLDGNGNWIVQHISRGETINLRLNTSDAEVISSEWANTEATDQLFSIGNSGVVNGLNSIYVAYLFAHDPSPSGLIQCGQYTGNGSSTGPVVNLGWEPQWLLAKRSNAVGNWSILDNKRDPANPRLRRLIPNLGDAEVNSFSLDFTQTGFQPRNGSGEINASGSNYIYLAIRKGKA